jgi:hypothetical protein
MKLLAIALHWLGKQFLSLLMIVLILVAGSYLYTGIQNYIELSGQLNALNSGQGQILSSQTEFEAKAKKRIQAINKGSRQELDQQIALLDREIATLETQRRSELERKFAFVKGDFHQDIKLELHIEILKQGRKHLEKAKAVLDITEAITKGEKELERRRLVHVFYYKELQSIESQIAILKANSFLPFQIPGTAHYQHLKFLEQQQASLLQQNLNANNAYWSQKRHLDQIKKVKNLDPFQPTRDAYTAAHSMVQEKIKEKEENLAGTWISKYVNPALDALPTALLILIGTILTPVAIKGVFYFIIAPIAGRRPPICLASESSGHLSYSKMVSNPEGNVSSVSLAVNVSGDEEFLVHPEYLKGMAENASKSTKWLLDWRYPLTSIVSGLYVLTRLQAEGSHTHTVSALEDPLAEVAQIEIPQGSRLVLQPQHVIGVIQYRGKPLRIESQWHLNSLTAWLTLQLRYMVFSGPVKIIVKGCRGVRIDPVGAGQSINQSATIGFTGNLSYSVTRCDPFIAYVRGKQELFNDKFAGASGYYISEEMPNLGKKSGITGKGLQGLADSALKVFGI